ncbi:MAG: alpha/beta hydrolase-fold protein [Bacteroidota bacterium]
MKKIKPITLTMLICLILASCQDLDYQQVRIPNTEERSLYSKIMDCEYGVYVTLPPGYKDNPDKIYPALYIIDGNQYFGFTVEPYGSLIWGNMIKDHIAISVAYRPGQINYRSRDFRTPERAADFVKFFQTELIPFVEDNYRTSKKDRTLFGHSLGGHFTLFMMLNAPETFENFIASAPAVSDEIMKFEEGYAASHDDFPVKLFLASGENDHLTIGAKRFAEKIKSRNYPSLKFGELYTVNGNHGTIQPSAYIEGLRFVLDRAIDLAPEKFERLAGSYVDGDKTYTLRYDGGNFLSLDDVSWTYDAWIDAPLVEWTRIYPVSETTFVSEGWPGTFEFGGDLSSPAKTFGFTISDKQIKARRLP